MRQRLDSCVEGDTDPQAKPNAHEMVSLDAFLYSSGPEPVCLTTLPNVVGAHRLLMQQHKQKLKANREAQQHGYIAVFEHLNMVILSLVLGHDSKITTPDNVLRSHGLYLTEPLEQ